ncbi:hypothetical protein OG982_26820 [Streptomyces sp. NBC_01551]|uniref:hypothetical protein n=1 Tax=Streptomyces sp. NBC_01551 TaxID=2975876 RepID=UPI00225091D0|nr:hypothetical protein [Streptomyces sp. NBC_01551]MCX4529264.1 hypothetical protein [Streptomyces sp. NBC_01551]
MVPVVEGAVLALAGLVSEAPVSGVEGAVVGEAQHGGVDRSFVEVHDLQSQPVVAVGVDRGGEVDAEPQREVWGGGGVVGMADDGGLGVGQREVVGEELFGEQGQRGSSL